MVLVKGGKFVMGSDDSRSYPNSRPPHPMSVGDFYLDVNEVTNEEYYQFIGRTGIPAPPQWKNGRFKPGTEKLPVVNVSWFDAKAYASWAKKRLPTEAEWEYAARGVENKAHPWGDDWYPSYANLKESGRGNPVEVGSCPSGHTWCGVNDMVGNVAEWVNDEWYPYPGSVGKTDAGLRIYRGGSFSNSKDKLLMTNRSFDSSGQKLPDVGFRCAKDVLK
jgi:formylglycine-generating enzyme required for sulfatase activity